MSELGIQEHEEAAAIIAGCLNPDRPKSFFFYAGAGSGKTRSLVDALVAFRESYGERFRYRGQVFSVITFTNAACEEIKRRLNHDPVIQVSTIHSFVWELIKGFDAEIRKWLHISLQAEIAELESLIAKGRPGTKTRIERERSLKAKRARLENLPSAKRFTYSPNGDNRARDSLNHSEVIKIGAAFLNEKSLMRKLVVSGSPFILVDESQDTNRELMEALLSLQGTMSETFGLGLFGDMMQRIYADGKSDLGQNVPASWAKPQKTVNFRCPRRVVRLINQIRSADDGRQQVPTANAIEGHARLFVIPTPTKDKQAVEQRVRDRMADITGDAAWKVRDNNKALILEHHMAATRMGFLKLFEPLSKVAQFSTGLRDGSIGFLRLFSDQVLPVVDANQRGDKFAVGSIVRKYSPLLTEEAMFGAVKQQDQLVAAKAAVDHLSELCGSGKTPAFQQVLNLVAETNLFEIPGSMLPFVEDSAEAAAYEEYDEAGERTVAIRGFLAAPFSEIRAYSLYVQNLAAFGTHQGVKGLEFPRVMVIIDDEDARGFTFSYDKLFGTKEQTKADLENKATGKETSIDRTRRLLYVTCSRSGHSLAIVAYTSNPSALQNSAIRLGWFDKSEVETIVE